MIARLRAVTREPKRGSTMNQCIGIGRLIGHRYRARESQVTYESNDQREYLHTIRRTYHGEVCERCGHHIERRVEVHPASLNGHMGPRRVAV